MEIDEHFDVVQPFLPAIWPRCHSWGFVGAADNHVSIRPENKQKNCDENRAGEVWAPSDNNYS